MIAVSEQAESVAAADSVGAPVGPPRRKARVRAASVVVALLGLLFLVGYVPKRMQRARLQQAARVTGAELVRVSVVHPRARPAGHSLSLPGTVEALESTVIYPRANGYVQRWLVDLGDMVHERDLLAEIDTPELDRQIDQALAAVAQADASIVQASATRDYSRTSLERYRLLTQDGLTSKQEFDQRQSQSLVDEANVGVARAGRDALIANLKRLRQLKAFARVVAPFDGVVLSRSAERGALVSAGDGQPLFEIATIDPVRVILQVPQNLAANIKPGAEARLALKELPGRTFHGVVARVGRSLDATLRTLKAEVRIPNAEQRLLPGMFANVRLELAAPGTVVSVPASSVVTSNDGPRVITVKPDGTAHFVPIQIARDTGSELELADGVSTDDQVITSPPPDLKEGIHVQISRGVP